MRAQLLTSLKCCRHSRPDLPRDCQACDFQVWGLLQSTTHACLALCLHTLRACPSHLAKPGSLPCLAAAVRLLACCSSCHTGAEAGAAAATTPCTGRSLCSQAGDSPWPAMCAPAAAAESAPVLPGPARHVCAQEMAIDHNMNITGAYPSFVAPRAQNLPTSADGFT